MSGRLCPGCGRELWSASKTCRTRSCPSYQQTWANDVMHVLLANLMRVDQVRLVVVTAPGQNVLPWDRSKCSHGEDVVCSGPRGCRVDVAARDRWEKDLDRRWTKYRQAVVKTLRREGIRSPLLGFGDEDQSRGVWHRNVLLHEGRGAARCHALLRKHARKYGFGKVQKRRVCMSGPRAAGYLASYLSMTEKGPASLTARAARWSRPGRLFYITPKLTKVTKATITSQRRGRSLWALEAGLIDGMKREGYAMRDGRVICLVTGEVLWSCVYVDPPPVDVRAA